MISGLLLDTNVISEIVAPKPSSAVLRWFDALDEDRTFLSVMTVAEIRHGAERLTNGRRKKQLLEWVGETLPERFAGRLLSVDLSVAQNWGVIVAGRQAVGRPIASLDALIAATALTHGLSLATRDIADFETLGLQLIDPWAPITREDVRG